MTERSRSGVPETMPQIVYACAGRAPGAVRSMTRKRRRSSAGWTTIFSLADSDTAMRSGVIARTLVFDGLVRGWLGSIRAPSLSTRLWPGHPVLPVDGYAHYWYDLDLPETIAVRERLLPEHGAISQLAMSAMDDWGGEITEQGASVLSSPSRA